MSVATSAVTEGRAPQERMPALYLSHGAPPLADDPIWPGELAAWSAELPRPKAILMVSAHWEEAPLALGAVQTVPLVYDFWGFPEHYYQVRYAAPGAPNSPSPYGSCCAPRAFPSRTSRTAASTTAPTSPWSRCSPTPTSLSCRSPCRPSIR